MKDGLLKIKFGFNEPKEIEGIKVEVIMIPYNEEEEWNFISSPSILHP
jgi:hypothetical protein